MSLPRVTSSRSPGPRGLPSPGCPPSSPGVVSRVSRVVLGTDSIYRSFRAKKTFLDRVFATHASFPRVRTASRSAGPKRLLLCVSAWGGDGSEGRTGQSRFRAGGPACHVGGERGPRGRGRRGAEAGPSPSTCALRTPHSEVTSVEPRSLPPGGSAPRGTEGAGVGGWRSGPGPRRLRALWPGRSILISYPPFHPSFTLHSPPTWSTLAPFMATCASRDFLSLPSHSVSHPQPPGSPRPHA